MAPEAFIARLAFLAITAGSILCALIGSWVAEQCGRRKVEGMILGFLLGPFGVILEALLPRIPLASQPPVRIVEPPPLGRP